MTVKESPNSGAVKSVKMIIYRKSVKWNNTAKWKDMDDKMEQVRIREKKVLPSPRIRKISKHMLLTQ